MINKLIEHMHWANSKMIDWVKTDRKDAAEYLRLVSHILNAERVWISRANGLPGDKDTFKVHGLDELSALNDSNNRDFKKLLDANIGLEVEYKLFDGSPGKTRVEDMLIHAFSHGFHHVGQMSAMASRSGEKFPTISYLGFTRRKSSDLIQFKDGGAYERYMGVWSRFAGQAFLDWLKPKPGLQWLDVGCGSGAFTELLATRTSPAALDGIDPSEEQLEFARAKPPLRSARFHKGDAMALPFPDASFDAAVMPLVLFFVPEPARGVAEMARVVRPGGIVTAYGWDLLGGGFPYAALQEELRAMGISVPLPPSPGASGLAELREYWTAAGLQDVRTHEITVERTFAGFDEYWSIILKGPSFGPKFAAMSDAEMEHLKSRMRARLPTNAQAEITYGARANAVSGRTPIRS